MSIKHIAQPYLVYTTWDSRTEQDLLMWLEENIKSYYVVAFFERGALLNPATRDVATVTEKVDNLMQFQFECPRDALLFKLTWGGK